MSAKMSEMTLWVSRGSEKAGGLGGLAGSFGKLGLSPDMIGKFVPVIIEYAKSAVWQNSLVGVGLLLVA